MFHFLGFLFFLVLILFFVGLSVIGWFLRKLFGFGRRSSHTQQTSSHQQHSDTRSHKKDNSSSGTPKRKKIFEADEGEYVDFEEIDKE